MTRSRWLSLRRASASSAEWIHEQVKLQREAEDEAWEKIMEEQKLLTERRRSIDADINSNRELKRYMRTAWRISQTRYIHCMAYR